MKTISNKAAKELKPLRPKFEKVDDLFKQLGVPNSNGGRRYPLTEIWKKWYRGMVKRNQAPIWIEAEKASDRGWEIWDERDQESVCIPADEFQKELIKEAKRDDFN